MKDASNKFGHALNGSGICAAPSSMLWQETCRMVSFSLLSKSD